MRVGCMDTGEDVVTVEVASASVVGPFVILRVNEVEREKGNTIEKVRDQSEDSEHSGFFYRSRGYLFAVEVFERSVGRSKRAAVFVSVFFIERILVAEQEREKRMKREAGFGYFFSCICRVRFVIAEGE